MNNIVLLLLTITKLACNKMILVKIKVQKMEQDS